MMWVTQILSYWSRQVFAPGSLLRKKYQYFRDLLAQDRHCLEMMAEIEEVHYRNLPCDYARFAMLCRNLQKSVGNLVKSLVALNPLQYRIVKEQFNQISLDLDQAMILEAPETVSPWVMPLTQVLEESLAGGKARNITLLKNHGYTVPHGFCITTRAYNVFIAESQLRPRIQALLSKLRPEHADDFESICTELQHLVVHTPLPEELHADIAGMLTSLKADKLAFRSSAFGEDSELSFAGQYESLLNVEPNDWPDAYRRVLASKYTPQAVTYRMHAGLPDEHLPMAVLVLEMVDAKTSGLVYTSEFSDADVTGVYTVSGLGDKLVSGRVQAEEIFINKNGPADAFEKQPAYIKELVTRSLHLEELFLQPQDIEWVLNQHDELLWLQTRPLHALTSVGTSPPIDLPVLAGGGWASPGLTSGTVFILASRRQISQIPEGSIVVAGGLYPELTAALGRIGGVIAEQGSAASHFATIAREHAVPVIINVAKAMTRFQPGETLTLDGHRAVVHEGWSEVSARAVSKPETWFSQRVQAVLEYVATLNLTDAASEAFQPQNCRSMHDLIRYTHEMGVREMFALADRKGRGLHGSKMLELEIPLAFRILNLEDGLTPEGDNQANITLKHVTCDPFQALFAGLTYHTIEWDMNIQHFDWEQFDKLSGGIFNPVKSPLLSSYGLLARDYMHVLIRFGYHFVVVDALLGQDPELNYIQFSFKGGGADESQRLMRLQAIRNVLNEYDFNTGVRGDLLTADYNREGLEKTAGRLKLLGYILGSTRLKDMSMTESEIQKMTRRFIGDIHALLAL